MCRGLTEQWKQSVYYNFGKAFTKDVLLDMVRLDDGGYTVVAVTCDLGPNNTKLLTNLQIGTELNDG